MFVGLIEKSLLLIVCKQWASINSGPAWTVSQHEQWASRNNEPAGNCVCMGQQEQCLQSNKRHYHSYLIESKYRHIRHEISWELRQLYATIGTLYRECSLLELFELVWNSCLRALGNNKAKTWRLGGFLNRCTVFNFKCDWFEELLRAG